MRRLIARTNHRAHNHASVLRSLHLILRANIMVDLETALQTCARLLSLQRPLSVFDLETTGIDPTQDGVIQIGIARLSPSAAVEQFESLVNPGRPIPPEVEALTGISNEDVDDAPCFNEVAADIQRLLGGADLAGYNLVRFDFPFLEQSFEQHGLALDVPSDRQLLDVYQIFRKHVPHSLEQAVAHYVGKPVVQSHRALDDVHCTAAVLAAQLAQHGYHGDLEGVVREVRHPHLDAEGKLRAEGDGVVLTFGKHEGRTVADLMDESPGYLDWIEREIAGEVGRIIRERREALAPANKQPLDPPEPPPSSQTDTEEQDRGSAPPRHSAAEGPDSLESEGRETYTDLFGHPALSRDDDPPSSASDSSRPSTS